MSIGESLADARLRAGLTVTQVSRQTRIRESIIRDIEQSEFSSSGGDFYARGHIRSIAGVVGTDPVPLISEYDSEHGTPAVRAADVFEPSRPVKIRDRRGPSLSLIVAVVLLAIIGFGAYRLYVHRHPSHPVASPSHHPTASAKPTPHHSASASASAKPSPAQVVIHVTANQDCWILLTKRSDGSQIYMGVVSAGSSMTWTEKQAVTIQLGNPPGIVLIVNGKIRSTNVNNPETLNFSPQSS